MDDREQQAIGPREDGEPDAGAAGFDFLHGRWDVRHRKLRRRLEGCTEWFEFAGTLAVEPILSGGGNFDHNVLHDPEGSYEAHSLRLYNPNDGAWSVWWLSSRTPGDGLGPAVRGRFVDGAIALFGDDTFAGHAIDVRTTYTPNGDDRAQWTQAFLATDGTWEVNWIMDFARALR